MCGQPKGKKMPRWKEVVLRWSIKIPARIHMLMGGVIWCGWNQREDVCYKKWLGADWKPTFEGAGI